MSEKKGNRIQDKIKEVSKIDFNSKKFTDEFKRVSKENEALMLKTKVDAENLSKRFEV